MRVSELVSAENDQYQLEEIFGFQQLGLDESNRAFGRFYATGYCRNRSSECGCLGWRWRIQFSSLQLPRALNMNKSAESYRWVGRAEHDASSIDRWFNTTLAVCGIRESASYVVSLAIGVASCSGMGLFVLFEDIIVAIIVAGIVLAVLFLGLCIWRQVRVLSVSQHLPAAVSLLSRSVESGDSLATALGKVGSKTPEPLGNELRQFARQIELGLPMNRFLHRLDQRYRLADVRMLGSTLIMHERSGGDLGHTLSRLAFVLNDRQQYRRQASSVTVTARLSAILVV